MNTIEIREKIQKKFNWNTILENLPTIALIGGGILVLDKLVDLGTKLEPVYKKVKNWNADGIFEIIDTVGDNMQIVDLILKALKIEISSDELKKASDFLQNLGTVGKHVNALWSLIAPKIKKARIGASSSGNYKQLK